MIKEQTYGGIPHLETQVNRQDQGQKEKVFFENLALLESINEEILQSISELVKNLEESGTSTISEKARSTMLKIKNKVDQLHELATTKFKAYQLPFDLVQYFPLTKVHRADRRHVRVREQGIRQTEELR